MKDFNKEYIYEQMLINETFGEVLKNFWNWLIGKNTDKKYLPCEHTYDKSNISSALSKYNKTWKFGPIDFKKVKEYINIYTEENKDTSDFAELQKYITNNFKEDKSGNVMWFAMFCIVKDADIYAPAGICCVSNANDVEKSEIRIYEALPYYDKHIGEKQLGDFIKYILDTTNKPLYIEKLDVKDILKLIQYSDIKLNPSFSTDTDTSKKKINELKHKDKHITATL